MSKRYILSEAAYNRLQDVVNNYDFPADADESYERYNEAVTCGNADDSYRYGSDEGEALLAAEILDGVTIENA